MRGKFKITLFSILFALLWMPIIQQCFKLFNETELKGAYVKPESPNFTIDSFNSLEFQKQFEDYENFNFGFRAFFVKMKNSINYIIFSELSINDNIAGKEGFIFSLSSAKRTTGENYNGFLKNNITLDKIEFMKNEIEKRGGHFLVLIAPSKESVIPEYLPRPYNTKFKDSTDYADFVEGYKKRNINFIDYCEYFKKIKETQSSNLFTKTGFHWSIYGASLALDTLVNYIEKTTDKPIPQYKRIGVDIADNARDSDNDFEGPLNLMFSLEQKSYMYPKFKIDTTTTNRYKPKAIVIGDSYFWQIKGLQMLKHVLSNDSKYWYYFSTTSYPMNDSAGVPMKELDIMKELESSDYVILISNIGNYETFPFGVTDYYYNNSSAGMIHKIKEGVALFSNTIHKLSHDTLLKRNPEEIFKNKLVCNLKAFNNKFVYSDDNQNNTLIANREKINLSGMFTLFELEENMVVICSHSNKFLSTELNSKTEITATRDNIGAWEIFKIIHLEDNFIAFQASNGKYLSVNPKSNLIFANSSIIGEHEKFKLIPHK